MAHSKYVRANYLHEYMARPWRDCYKAITYTGIKQTVQKGQPRIQPAMYTVNPIDLNPDTKGDRHTSPRERLLDITPEDKDYERLVAQTAACLIQIRPTNHLQCHVISDFHHR